MPYRIKTFRSIATPSIEDDPDRKEAKAFYSSPRWGRLRAMKLRMSPQCQCGCGDLANEVHHIVDRRECPERAFDMENLEALTKQCHARITRQRQLEALNNLDD